VPGENLPGKAIKEEIEMKRLLAALAVLATIGAIAVSGASASATQVSGVQEPTGVEGVSTMTGDLVGTWYETTPLDEFLAALRVQPSGTIQFTGTELFVGCLGAVCGTLSFEYHAELKLVTPDYVQLIFGRCQHKVTGGTGGFAGASGVLTFRDDPETGCSYYKGHIDLP
jgi:hypothetical protein